MVLKEELHVYARENGIPLLGVAGVEPFVRAHASMVLRGQSGYLSGWEEKDLCLRTQPQRVMPGARTLISIALPYFNEQAAPSGNLWGRVSRSAWGKDYHQVVQIKLEGLMNFLSNRSPQPITYRLMVDTGPLADREVANRAGIGHFGKNCTIITRDYGSWVFLGEALIDLEMDPDPPARGECGCCDLCISACPTGALTAPYTLNATKCLAYITQQPGSIPRQLRPLLGNRLYGCDLCQEVCPGNRIVNLAGSLESGAKMEAIFPSLSSLIDMDEHHFQLRWGNTSAAWRGRRNMIRNGVVALGNSGDIMAIPPLIKALAHPSPVIRGHAAWALGRIGGKEARQALEQRGTSEREGGVLEEIELALSQN
ncbi:MAG: tRNA epoxyqueuosine(34) reductase QueG [Bacillota bacterium]